MGKAKRKLFTEIERRDTELLDAVSTDTTGPITPADRDGYIYIQLLVDEATRHTQGFTLRKKSEALAAILKAPAVWS